MSSKASEPSAPEIREAVQRDRQENIDCLACRATGAAAFMGLGVYTFISGHNQMWRNQREIVRKSGKAMFALRRGSITLTSMGLIALGGYRLFVV